MYLQQKMQGESAELQMWQQVLQLAQSGSQDALGEIVQIATQAIQQQEAEMKEMQSEGQQSGPSGKPSLQDKLKQAMLAKRQQQAQEQAPQGQEGVNENG
jgi:uncharacterized protein (DUF305 family)